MVGHGLLPVAIFAGEIRLSRLRVQRLRSAPEYAGQQTTPGCRLIFLPSFCNTAAKVDAGKFPFFLHRPIANSVLYHVGMSVPDSRDSSTNHQNKTFENP